jgi:hypothetical protein
MAPSYSVQTFRRRFPESHRSTFLVRVVRAQATFDNIVLGHVLEHVADPCALLKAVRGWLSPDGAVYAAGAKRHSVHRQAAVIMGLLPDEHALNATDIHHGHRRVYDPESFRGDFRAAGLSPSRCSEDTG